jgi:hypothetical protein
MQLAGYAKTEAEAQQFAVAFFKHHFGVCTEQGGSFEDCTPAEKTEIQLKLKLSWLDVVDKYQLDKQLHGWPDITK